MTPAQPPIVLVGGAPGAGKTTLARAVAARVGTPTQTFDHVVTAIRAITSPETHQAFHRGRMGHVGYFTESSPDQLIEDAIALEQACWPAIERICGPSRARGEGFVMDWWLLPPRQLAGASIPDVVAMWIEIDSAALERRERANEWFFSSSADPDRMFTNFMARSTWANEHYPSQARSHGLPVIRQPGNRPTAELVDDAIAILSDRGFAFRTR